ncbi:hypothetical protein [Flavobacterium chilense]|uniref:Uncharacterized protein n=1 Tax=Flavobacterium chilense TaxID=946677 RepID=A0A1M7ESL0_9FLAO|nr:hypothetical protein [Flavobacterium chilense]SHL94566.1 hypothetical protein SAMN05444484_10352 [Flavobacterium chilense]
MATDRTNIGYKFEKGDIPSQEDFQEVFKSFVHIDEDKADFQMVEAGTDNQHYVTPALLYTGLKNIGIITGNNYMPRKEHFDSFVGDTITLQYAPVNYSVKVFKNGQLLLEKEGQGNDGDYIINYEMAKITFSGNIDNRNIEVDYWYKNLAPNTNPGGGSGQQIDFTSFLHTTGNETKNGILTFNNTTPTSTSGIVLTNSGTDVGAKVLDVTVSGTGSGIAVQNTATGTGIKLSNSGAGTGIQVNSTTTSTGDSLKVTKDNVVKAKIDSEGIVSAEKFVSARGQRTEFVKGDGFLDPTTYAEDNKVIHTSGNESKDGALKLKHDNSVEDVLTITKNNSANCLKLVQNSTSNATTSTFYTSTDDVNRKAISVQKKEQENAFITHDGNVSGTSFTTLNEKADITDGLLTLAGSTSQTATAGHAKLYAKTDGTTDLYVMGSDGIEKKIGGEVDLSGKENTIATGTTAQYFRGDKTWQTLDKTAVGLANVDNTSDLNKPVSTATQTALDNVLHKTGYATETKNGELVIDSGVSDVSGLKLKKILSSSFSSGSAENFSAAKGSGIIKANDGFFYSVENSLNKIQRISPDGLTITDFVTTGLNNPIKIIQGNDNFLYVTCISGAPLRKIDIVTGAVSIVTTTGVSINVPQGLVQGIDGNLYIILWSDNKIVKVDMITFKVTDFCTSLLNNAREIIKASNGFFYVINQSDGNIIKVDSNTGNASVLKVNVGNMPSSITQGIDSNLYVTRVYANTVQAINISTGENVGTGVYMTNGPQDIVSVNDTLYSIGTTIQSIKILTDRKVLKTDSTGLIIKTTFLEDIQYLKATDVDLSNLVTKNNLKTINGVSILGSGDIVTASEPSQITITTTTSITTDTPDTNGKKQIDKNVIINNGTSAINITVNGGTDFNASYLKHGTGAITFVQAAERTLVQVNATATLNGAAGSTATISSIGTTDYLRISNV